MPNSVKALIAARRSIFEFKPEPVPDDVVENLCEAGIWAPNHKHTEPWRFTLVGPEARKRLAERYRRIQVEKGPDMSEEACRRRGEQGLRKFRGKPTVLVASCLQEGDDHRRREDYAAACCAMQNVQLAAWEAGVGMQWSTGAITREAATYDLLGIDPERETIIGFFYMGYPAKVPRARRKPLAEVFRRTR